MVKFDDQAGVFEAYSDSDGTEWIGAFDTFAEARLAVKEHLCLHHFHVWRCLNRKWRHSTMTETQLDAAFYVHRETGIFYDVACALVREAALHDASGGIIYDAHMLAEITMEMIEA